jgi:hypothetical protein
VRGMRERGYVCLRGPACRMAEGLVGVAEACVMALTTTPSSAATDTLTFSTTHYMTHTPSDSIHTKALTRPHYTNPFPQT